jgi:hypothetical protein
VKEEAIVKSTRSFSEGLKSWWTKRHVEICDKTLDMGLFGVGIGLCQLAGVSGLAAVGVAVLQGVSRSSTVLRRSARRPQGRLFPQRKI